MATLHVLRRDGDRCLWCGKALGRGEVARHHRMRRRVGGDRLANILLLHGDCHRFIHANPIEARGRGFIVSVYSDMLGSPVVAKDGRAWLLDDQGGREPVEGIE
jgi:hypothetical protein